MITTVAKWGNSLAVRIPKSLAQEISLTEQAEIELSVVDGVIMMKPRVIKSYSLEELIQEITPENLHGEVDSGEAMGNEAW